MAIFVILIDGCSLDFSFLLLMVNSKSKQALAVGRMELNCFFVLARDGT